MIIYLIICNLISRLSHIKNKHINYKKQATIIGLFKTVIKVLIVVIVFMMILSVYGVDTTAIVASLGVVGVVVVNIKQNFWPALGEGRAIQSFVLYKLIYLDIPGSFEFFQLYAQVSGSRVRFLFQVHEIRCLYRQEQGDYCQT